MEDKMDTLPMPVGPSAMETLEGSRDEPDEPMIPPSQPRSEPFMLAERIPETAIDDADLHQELDKHKVQNCSMKSTRIV